MQNTKINYLLLCLAMLLNTLSFDFATFSFSSFKTWLFLMAFFLLLLCTYKLVIDDTKTR
ncbi:hypothetical protein [Croceivirga radicis]|uniref:hypothetical protein n=1 Tax=Croceivirga radicis TaxID=1929488 RepID=UPI0012FF05B1|nr:hypothetical protein [Croceivirga radicis]